MKSRESFIWTIFFCLIIAVAGVYFYVYRSKSENMVCTRMPAVKIRGREPAFTPNYKLAWPNKTVLRVYFEEGKTNLSDSVMRVAQEWSKYCSIKFVFAKSILLSDVRVTFNKGGLASAIGRECKQPEYHADFTTFLEGISKINEPSEFRRIVLHEFGHALGLEHELRNPNARISWDKEKVYDYYEKEFQWGIKKVDDNIFKPLEPGDKPYGEFDRTSIMVYAIGPPLANETIPWAKELSSSDKSGIAIWYPKF